MCITDVDVLDPKDFKNVKKFVCVNFFIIYLPHLLVPRYYLFTNKLLLYH